MTKQKKSHLKFALNNFLTWLNWKDAPVDDFRRVADVVVRMSIEAEAGPLSYEADMRFDRKLDAMCRRIFQRFPTYEVPCLVREFRATEAVPFVDRRPVRRNYQRNPYDVEARFQISFMFELFRAGTLGKIRRCEWQGLKGSEKRKSPPCGRYFYGRAGKRFCSGACKRKNFRQRPNFREVNAIHQRVHYRAEKVKELGELAAVNPAHRKEYEAAKKALERVRKLADRAKKRLASRGR
jgi:hypothetical protein